MGTFSTLPLLLLQHMCSHRNLMINILLVMEILQLSLFVVIVTMLIVNRV